VRNALLAALLLTASARAATLDVVRRRDVLIRVQVGGTVVTHDIFRLKATIDGRVEAVYASTGAWRAASDPLATLSSVELAAMLDARGSQDQEVLQDRWGKVYAPTPVRCPSDCYVLRNYLRPKSWVKPQAVLFEAARGLRLVARVKAKDVRLLRRPGLMLTYWPTSDPERRRSAPVTALVSDANDGSAAGASFEVELTPRDGLAPGTEWSGEIVARIDRSVLAVPSTALIRQGGFYYLPMRVQVGITGDGLTEILAGTEEGRPFLTFDDAELHALRGGPGATPGEATSTVVEAPGPVVEEEATDPTPLPKRAPDSEAPAPAPAPAPKPKPAPAPPPPKQQDFGDDPYGR
jgi:hypothetical protein